MRVKGGSKTLLAALLRAREIPSRVVFGLKWSPGNPNRMAYHAWTIAHVDDQWLHLDATEGGVAAADRIAFATSNLNGGNECQGLIPFLDAIGKIKLEVVRAQY